MQKISPACCARGWSCSSQSASSPKEGAKFFAEEETSAGEGDGEEAHSPDTEGTGDIATFAEELEKLVDGLGDREVLLLLGQDKGVAHLQHGEGKSEESASEEVRCNEGERDFAEGLEGRASEIVGGFLEGNTGLLKPSGGGANNVRETSNGVGNH